MSAWFRNGEAVETASIDDRAFQYGDGLFETLAIRAGKARLWDFHIARLARGCRVLGIAMPEPEYLLDQVMAAVAASNEHPAYCIAKIIISSGVGRRGYGRAAGQTGQAYIGVFAARPPERSAYRQGVETVLCEAHLAVHSPLAGLKTLNRLEQVLGRSEVLAAGAFEGLMLDAEERLICGTMSNVFIVTAQSVKTPSLARCGVEGVMRSLLIAALDDEGIDVEECDIRAADFKACDEVFLTNSQFGALPVRRCGSASWPVGPRTRDCMAVLAGRGIAECRV